MYRFNDPENNASDITQIAQQCGNGITPRWAGNSGVDQVDGKPTAPTSGPNGRIYKIVDGETDIKHLPNSAPNGNGLNWSGSTVTPDGKYLPVDRKN